MNAGYEDIAWEKVYEILRYQYDKRVTALNTLIGSLTSNRDLADDLYEQVSMLSYNIQDCEDPGEILGSIQELEGAILGLYLEQINAIEEKYERSHIAFAILYTLGTLLIAGGVLRGRHEKDRFNQHIVDLIRSCQKEISVVREMNCPKILDEE